MQITTPREPRSFASRKLSCTHEMFAVSRSASSTLSASQSPSGRRLEPVEPVDGGAELIVVAQRATVLEIADEGRECDGARVHVVDERLDLRVVAGPGVGHVAPDAEGEPLAGGLARSRRAPTAGR